MILVTFRHGLRATEVVSLTRDNFADGYLDVQRLKGSNRTVQVLAVPPCALDQLIAEAIFKMGHGEHWNGITPRFLPDVLQVFTSTKERYGRYPEILLMLTVAVRLKVTEMYSHTRDI